MKLRYVCKHCGRVTSINSVWEWFFTPHFGAKKWLKCRHCIAKRTFMSRSDGRKWIDWPTEKRNIDE